MADLEKVLMKLKKSQSCDTMSMVNEIFIPENIGDDLKISLLSFFNQIKKEVFIPNFMKNVYITAIPKKKVIPKIRK